MKPLICSSYKQIEDMLYYTIGQDNNVKVGCVQIRGDEAKICIEVRHLDQAEALRNILPECYEWGMRRVYIHVLCKGELVYGCSCAKYNQRSVASLFCRALRTNQLFVGVKLHEQSFVPVRSTIDVYIKSCLLPIQCGEGCYNQQVANEVFAQVLRREFGLIISTEVFYRDDSCRRENRRCLFCVGDCFS